MSILERVYTTFNHLDRDYARSKKTRTEFITDKFGGDINTGAIIILDAIRAEGVEETPENIAMMSFVKDTFASIQANADHLDALSSFSFADTNVVGAFVNLLCHAELHETKQEVLPQSTLWGWSPKVLHYYSTAEGTSYADPDNCTVFMAYNENMAGLLSGLFKPDRDLELGGLYKVLPGRRLKTIQEGAVTRNLRG